MVNGLLCSSSGTAVVPVHADHEELVVRYSAFDKIDLKDDQENTSKGGSQTSHLKDELGIMRLSDRQRVTFHLKRRTDNKAKKDGTEIEILKRASSDITTEIKHKIEEHDLLVERQKTVALLRRRVSRLIKEMQKDYRKGSSLEKRTRKHSMSRPHTVTSARTKESTQRSENAKSRRDEDDRNIAMLASIRNGVTAEEAQELKRVLGDILRKKLGKREGSKDGSMQSQESNPALVKDSVDESVKSSERHTRRRRKPSSRGAEASEDTKVATSEAEEVSQRCMEFLRDRLHEDTAKEVPTGQDDVIDSGDKSDITKTREVQSLFHRDSSRPKLRLNAVGRSSRDSTADWIMKQNFHEFKYANEDSCDATAEKDSF